MRLATAVRDALNDAFTAQLNAGSGQPYLEVYDAEPPASFGGSYGNLLASCTLSNPAVGASSGGIAQFLSIISDPSAPGHGTPRGFRLFNGDGVAVADGNAGELEAGEDGIAYTGSIQQAASFGISTGQITAGNTEV